MDLHPEALALPIIMLNPTIFVAPQLPTIPYPICKHRCVAPMLPCFLFLLFNMHSQRSFTGTTCSPFVTKSRSCGPKIPCQKRPLFSTVCADTHYWPMFCIFWLSLGSSVTSEVCVSVRRVYLVSLISPGILLITVAFFLAVSASVLTINNTVAILGISSSALSVFLVAQQFSVSIQSYHSMKAPLLT